MLLREKSKQQDAFTAHAEWFGAFLRHTDQKLVTKKAILEGIQTNFPKLWGKIATPEQPLNLLYVGVGNGGLEIPLTKEFIKAHSTADNINVFCEDPSEEMMKGFNQKANDEGLSDNIKAYDLNPFESEEYKPPEEKADLAIASHVWYYVNGWRDVPKDENSLTKFANTIAQDGVGLIALQSQTSDNFAIRSVQSPRIHNTNELAGEEVVAELDKLGIEHKQVIIESHTDVSQCFQDGVFNPTDEGKLLLSFILRADWDKLTGNSEKDNETREMVAKKLTEIVETNQKLEMVFRDSYIWIPGQQPASDLDIVILGHVTDEASAGDAAKNAVAALSLQKGGQ